MKNLFDHKLVPGQARNISSPVVVKLQNLGCRIAGVLHLKKTGLIVTLVFILAKTASAQIVYPGANPGQAAANLTGPNLMVWNNNIKAQWVIRNQKISIASFADKVNHQQIVFNAAPLFELTLKNGTKLTSDHFTLKGLPVITTVQGKPDAIKYADRLAGKKVSFDFTDKNGINLHWEMILTDGANYLRQVLSLKPADSLYITKITLINIPSMEGLHQVGSVDGCPLIWKTMFFAIEHPMSQIENFPGSMACFLPRQASVTSTTGLIVSSVWGATPSNQLRRGYLYYVERERAAPYHQFLHYNSWYDLSWVDRKLDETNCIDRIQTFADSLIQKRGVPMNAFLFDDGWDDNQTLWLFNKGFPNGFTKMAQVAKKYNSDLGVWISPWGGYMEDQQQRLKYGRSQNPPFETNHHGFSLSGPTYYQRFKEATSKFATQYNVSIFKFDGVGGGNGASGASVTYQKDIEALLKLIGDLRTIKPQLYFSLTVGTWPSVYWLNYGDVIWRAGRDTHFAGTGSKRQQWITYRDGEAYRNVVKRAPLYPLNALMYHGICIADNGPPGTFEMNDKDITDEIWSYFGTGASLQELYVNPHKLSTANWNTLASAIKWSKKNADVLSDVHWVGGDPEKAEVYGYAAWSAKKAVLSLRNPSAQTKTFHVNAAKVFDIPAGFTKTYRFYGANTTVVNGKPAASGNEFIITLAPYEVKVFDAY